MGDQVIETTTPPQAAIHAIADTSRYDAPTEARDLDAECAMATMLVLPLKERIEIALWLLNAR